MDELVGHEAAEAEHQGTGEGGDALDPHGAAEQQEHPGQRHDRVQDPQQGRGLEERQEHERPLQRIEQGVLGIDVVGHSAHHVRVPQRQTPLAETLVGEGPPRLVLRGQIA